MLNGNLKLKWKETRLTLSILKKKICDNNKNRIFTKKLNLHPGTYEYKFLVDGEWRHDPKLP